MTVTLDTLVEEILNKFPETMSFFIENGVSPFSCSGAYPSSLGELLKRTGKEDAAEFVKKLNEYIQSISG
ncbi:MAG TPA: hypothetical protein GYA09_00875 [Firmicutes bacterium]|nr:hypothetical protein [Candidatus Fermentithermobacillaceae bacterium]